MFFKCILCLLKTVQVFTIKLGYDTSPKEQLYRAFKNTMKGPKNKRKCHGFVLMGELNW